MHANDELLRKLKQRSRKVKRKDHYGRMGDYSKYNEGFKAGLEYAMRLLQEK